MSCKKYSEDQSPSFKTVFKRVTSHSWRIKHYFVNNQDFADTTFYTDGVSGAAYAPNGLPWHHSDLNITFTTARYDLGKHRNNPYTVKVTNSPRTFIGHWEFYGKKNEFGGVPNFCYLKFGVLTENWNIKSLTVKQFVVEASTNLNNHIRVEMVKY